MTPKKHGALHCAANSFPEQRCMSRLRSILPFILSALLCAPVLAQPKPPETTKPAEQRQPTPPSARPTLSLPSAAGPAAGAGQPAAAISPPTAARPAAAPAASAATASPAAQVQAWEGRWTGVFGARTDMTVTISGGKVTAVAVLGQPLTVVSSTVTPMTVSASGPDFKIDLARFTVTAGQGIYENARQEKAIAAFQKM
jgi:hypothetical protein